MIVIEFQKIKFYNFFVFRVIRVENSIIFVDLCFLFLDDLLNCQPCNLLRLNII